MRIVGLAEFAKGLAAMAPALTACAYQIAALHGLRRPARKSKGYRRHVRRMKANAK